MIMYIIFVMEDDCVKYSIRNVYKCNIHFTIANISRLEEMKNDRMVKYHSWFDTVC